MRQARRFRLIRIFFLSLALLFLAAPFPVRAEGVIAGIQVVGSQRIEPETIKSYLRLEPGGSFSPESLRDGLKALYDTGFFRDVALEREGDFLVVRVEENPMISEVVFEGIESFTEEELGALTRLKAQAIYNRAGAERDLAALRQAYRIKGLFLAEIEALIKPLDNNRVNLIFRVEEGDKSKVREVRIIGNNQISASRLMKNLMIQPSGWFSWFSEDDTYDREKLLFDQAQLRDIYLNEGYARVRVDSSVAEMTPDRSAFVVTHTLHEGERYRFGAIRITGDFDELPQEALFEDLEIQEGNWYSRELLRDAIETLSDRVGDFGYALLDIQPELAINDETLTIDVTLKIRRGQRVYVNRIEVTGNSRTRDEVIRRELRISEGDRFSASRIRTSKERLERLGFFESVEVATPPAGVPDRVNLRIRVEEGSTGAFTVGAGFSSVDKVVGTASVSQNNFLGKGQRVTLSFTLSARTSEFNLAFTEPYFMGRNMSAGFDIFNRKTNRLNTSSFKQSTFGGGLRLGFPLTDNLSDSLSYHVTHVEITELNDNASATIQDQADRSPYIQAMLSNTLAWSDLDDPILPTTGRIHRLTGDVAGLGGDVRFLRLLTDNSFYHTLIGRGDLVGHVRARAGVVQGIGEDVPIFERYFLGGPRSLRGFQPGGIGPRTTDGEALGGTHFGQLNSELLFPFLGLGDKGVRGITFVDVGVLGDMDQLGTNTQESETPRVSTGFGVLWSSPFGPLRFEFGFPLSQEDYDNTRSFDFSIGTVL